MGIFKLKECAGFDGIPHLDYIYKNIDGKKYCKSCTLKLQKPKPINKVSEKQVFRMKLKRELVQEDIKFYKDLWEKRFPVHMQAYDHATYSPKCQVCSKRLSTEPNLMYFHHILEKRNYPEYRHTDENIAIVCPECHSKYETNPDMVPLLVERRRELLDKFDLVRNDILLSILKR